MRFQTLRSWLDWIESCHPSEIDLGLERIGEVASRLNISFETSQVITVAGTNGKGSCVAVLESLVSQSGYSVGCYTSPHFLRYNERIKINGVEVDDQTLVDTFHAIDVARQDISLTYFEFGTLAALLIFASASLDVVVLEVGLGGRLDAANLIDADIAVVTNIALDHEDWLGSDLDVIGREKAGIFRSGKVALCGDPKAPVTVRETAELLGARFYQRGLHFDGLLHNQQLNWHGLNQAGDIVSLDALPSPHLPLDSVIVAMQACQLLPFQIADDVYCSIAQIALTGRYQQYLVNNKRLIFDVAHNPAAASLLADRLAKEPIEGETYALFAVMADKDVSAIVSALSMSVDVWLLADLDDVPRALSAEQLSVSMAELSINNVTLYQTIKQACSCVLSMMTEHDRLLVFGSFFTVAQVLEVLKGDDQLALELILPANNPVINNNNKALES